MLKTKSKTHIVFIFICSILFLCSCDFKQALPGLWPLPTPTLAPELMDRSWLTGEPCRTPCWYDLEIGKTTLEDAQEKIGQLLFIDSSLTKRDGPILLLYCREQNT